MLTADSIERQLKDDLGLTADRDVLVHVNVTALGDVKGGVDAVLDALLAAAGTVVMPAFTPQTQVIPQTGPPGNATDYGSGDELNKRAEIYRPDLPIHPDYGIAAETLRQRDATLRSTHPILSFVAQGADAQQVLGSQTRDNPLGPIQWLEAHDGAILMMGLDHRHDVALHLAEQRAGRQTFTRWALTINDIEELHNIPGCREGFNAIWSGLMDFGTVAQIGMARCELIDMEPALAYTENLLRHYPNFMLCDKESCAYCRTREA